MLHPKLSPRWHLRILAKFFCAATLALLAGTSGAAPEWNGPAFYGDPPDATHPWSIHDRNRPQPRRVEPGNASTHEKPGRPPSDAIVLFDGTAESLAQWEADTLPGEPSQPTTWRVHDGALECVPRSGSIRTKELIGDCQLHVEWAAPTTLRGESQQRGNSGIHLGTRPGVKSGVEVQILDNYNNPSYADGMAGALYGINPPLVNPLRAPGEFQSADIVFRRPIFRDGRVIDQGRVTVFINGVLVQDSTPIDTKGGHLRRAPLEPFPGKGPLKFQNHGSAVRFRNIWYRPLPPRAIEGGTDGALTAEATTAKRAEIAAGIRADAATMKSDETGHMLRLAEALIYEQHAPTAREVERLAARYVDRQKSLSDAAREQQKNEAFEVSRAFAYLTRHDLLAPGFAPRIALERFIAAQGWEDPAKKKKG